MVVKTLYCPCCGEAIDVEDKANITISELAYQIMMGRKCVVEMVDYVDELEPRMKIVLVSASLCHDVNVNRFEYIDIGFNEYNLLLSTTGNYKSSGKIYENLYAFIDGWGSEYPVQFKVLEFINEEKKL